MNAQNHGNLVNIVRKEIDQAIDEYALAHAEAERQPLGTNRQLEHIQYTQEALERVNRLLEIHLPPQMGVCHYSNHAKDCRGPGDVKNHILPWLRERKITELMGMIMSCCGDKYSSVMSCGCCHTAIVLREKLR